MGLLEKPKQQQKLQEFQAIILAGYGSSNRLYPITEDDNIPKALLPVANKPLISYTLDWLEKAGITDAFVLTQSMGNAQQKIAGYLARGYQGNVHCNLIGVDEDFGTADAIRSIADRITTDFIVLPCDLHCEMIPREFLDHHRINSPTMTGLFYEPPKGEKGSGKEDELAQYIGIDTAESRLVHIADCDSSEDGDLSLRMSLLWRFPRVKFHVNLLDAHVYIFKHWVLDLIKAKEKISSIRQDLVPLIVKCQYQRKLVENEDMGKYAALEDPLDTALSLSTVYDEFDEKLLNEHDPYRSNFKSNIKVNTVIYRDGYCGRANTIAKYSEMNRLASKQGLSIRRVPETAEVTAKSQIGNDSLVGEYTKIAEKSSVKRSIIGAHCVIGKNVKIANSIIMDHVVLEDFVKLDGCIVCNNAKVLEGSSLTKCEVAGGYIVEQKTEENGQKLVGFREAI
ncbi:hypothetical protein INT44_002692 [Umbelopsis vinacea]|uniref:Translation initiation factor eIF2B subunit gamma n=1 Tax=Umbelopsis vinacea TaxID=44442 RepID=A0A8H7UKG5_9FUNG|nr:hypothetical protein INT44_002692 [Umbelopsis vinacea]KAI9290347.1 nucleotide-diphospho-sugar transferase [Umbelopsis sp. AD052]